MLDAAILKAEIIDVRIFAGDIPDAPHFAQCIRDFIGVAVGQFGAELAGYGTIGAATASAALEVSVWPAAIIGATATVAGKAAFQLAPASTHLV